MKPSYQKQHAALLKDLLAQAGKNLSKEEHHFAEVFFARTLLSDLEKMSAGYMSALVKSMFAFFIKRPAGESLIRIFTPTEKEHGYHNKGVVIEILGEDMPFLVDSLTNELTRHGLSIRETHHPIFAVSRDVSGVLTSLGESSDKTLESFIHFEVSTLPETLAHSELENDLRWVLNHIRAAVSDWKSILHKADDIIARLKKNPVGFDAATVSEVRDFLKWLVEKNFVFLGYGEYNFIGSEGHLKIAASNKLGILTIADEQSPVGLETMPEEQRHRLLSPQLIEITKSNRRSAVHRYVPMDYVAIKRFDDAGKVTGEVRFLGLFTSNVYYQSATLIPLLRDKIAKILARSGFSAGSHDGKALTTILEFLPRDEVFQMSEDELFEVCMGILALEARPGVRMFVRRDAFERFVSAMVFTPRECFSTDLRRHIQQVIERSYNGSTTAFTTQITDAPLARLHLIVRTSPGDIPAVDVGRVEKEIARLAHMWSDQLFDALNTKHDEHKARNLHKRYAEAFPPSYIASHDGQACAHDIDEAEIALAKGSLAVKLYQLHGDEHHAHLKIYNPNQEIALSDILPMLENAGFRVIEEQPYLLTPKGVEGNIWIRDFTLQLPATITNTSPFADAIEKALLAAWQGEIENDRLNALVLLAGLTYREVVILRALAKYLKQVGFNATQTTIEQSLGNNPNIARDLVALFHARFGLDVLQRDVKQHVLTSAIEKALEHVTSAVDDRIIRTLTKTITAIWRTNYYQENKAVLSFKCDSSAVPDLPLPKPYAEIFVYSPRVEGIHLRGGKVARGGLRWSDRPDDFRTEVLGLMKAQMVKNAVIVPVGSKGGFVLKKAPPASDREAFQKEGVACYTLYLQGLLDITDNLVDGKIVPPANVVRHDGDDPYLVVAADKGTATFSDIANAVSKTYNFWLGDAFASGGSVGYDHKKMAITARGAWISVVRHFKEMGKDIAREDFTCIGIGDMAGDVFGNGMLLSPHTRLVAAFNHMHIFIDPNPQAATSFEERKRLFHLPRSSWKDYDVKSISQGGGVFERSAKSIIISEEAQWILGATKTTFAPDELIRAILMAPVDLLWNGGIGTYVKAEDESHELAGDRTNNSVRVSGKELRCKVVGEGGNLGFTQKGRIEYAKNGGKLNTDAIDNSAGVDCSDHEVNIKIAFSRLLSTGKLVLAKRDEVLATMTDEVAELVLKDNTLQTLALSVAEQMGATLLDAQTRLIYALEKKGLLSRAIEFLPNDKQLADLKASARGLTRPELAVLLSYSKMDLYKSLIESDVLDDDYFADELLRYFPQAMQKDYREALTNHPLRREIIATVLTNSLVNRVGCTFVNEMVEKHDASPRDIAVAYALVRDAFGLRDHWRALDTLTGIIPVAEQAAHFNTLQHFVETLVAWLIAHEKTPLVIANIKSRIIDPAKKLAMSMKPEAASDSKLSPALAAFMASLSTFEAAFDIVQLSAESGLAQEAVGKIYKQLADRLKKE